MNLNLGLFVELRIFLEFIFFPLSLNSEIDIDECADLEKRNASNCNQLCVNLPGSYRCECIGGGYLMSDDGHTCKGKQGSWWNRIVTLYTYHLSSIIYIFFFLFLPAFYHSLFFSFCLKFSLLSVFLLFYYFFCISISSFFTIFLSLNIIVISDGDDGHLMIVERPWWLEGRCRGIFEWRVISWLLALLANPHSWFWKWQYSNLLSLTWFSQHSVVTNTGETTVTMWH